MADKAPQLIILGGANGAGKTTTAGQLLRGVCDVSEFVNADTIARGLSEFAPDSVAVEAGKIMLSRIRALAVKQVSFAIETTLASRSLAGFVKRIRHEQGYQVDLYFLSLPSAELAIRRVAERVRLGGHAVPEPVIRRRYER